MKLIRKKIFYFALLSLIGVYFLVSGNVSTANKTEITGFGAGLFVVGLLKVIQYIRLSKNPEQLKKFERMQKEERLIFLVQKSAYVSMLITELLELVAMAVLILIGKENEAFLISCIACFQIVSYLVLYRIFEKKY